MAPARFLDVFEEETNKMKENERKCSRCDNHLIIILKQLFSSGSMNLSNNPLDFVSGIIRQYSLRLRRVIVK